MFISFCPSLLLNISLNINIFKAVKKIQNVKTNSKYNGNSITSLKETLVNFKNLDCKQRCNSHGKTETTTGLSAHERI